MSRLEEIQGSLRRRARIMMSVLKLDYKRKKNNARIINPKLLVRISVVPLVTTLRAQSFAGRNFSEGKNTFWR